MMSELKTECPYCGAENSYYFHGEDRRHPQCQNCKKHFIAYSEAHWVTRTRKADCLNGGEHRWDKCSNKDGTVHFCVDCYHQYFKPNTEEKQNESKGTN